MSFEASSSGIHRHKECGRGIGSKPAGAAQRKARWLLAGEHDNLDATTRPEAGCLQRAQRCYATDHPQSAVVCSCQRYGIRVRARLHLAHCALRNNGSAACKLLRHLGRCSAQACCRRLQQLPLTKVSQYLPGVSAVKQVTCRAVSCEQAENVANRIFPY